MFINDSVQTAHTEIFLISLCKNIPKHIYVAHRNVPSVHYILKKKERKKIKNKLCVANQTSPTDSSFKMYLKIILLFKTPSQLQYFIPRPALHNK